MARAICTELTDSLSSYQQSKENLTTTNMNGTFITTGGEVYFISQDAGSYYRLKDGELEYQPIVVANRAGGIYDRPPVEEEWCEVDPYWSENELVDWEGKETEVKVVHQIVKTELENTKN